MIVFETPRLQAYKISQDDAPALSDIFGSIKAIPNASIGDQSLESAVRHMVVTNNRIPRNAYRLVLANRDNRLIGLGTIDYPNNHASRPVAEIGVAIDPGVRKQGFGLEAFIGLLRLCFNQGYASAFARTTPENEACIKLLKASGLKQQPGLSDGFVVCATKRDEWKACNHPSTHRIPLPEPTAA